MAGTLAAPSLSARLRSWLLRLRGIPRRERFERELDEELAFHIEMQTAELVERGIDPVEARRRALVSFGGVAKTKEEAREVRLLAWLEHLKQDLAYGLRVLRKQPAYAAAAILTLGLGIGANTAVFSLVNGVLLAPLPYGDGGRLVHVRQRAPLAGVERLSFSVAEIEDFSRWNRSFEEVAEYHAMTFTLLGRGEPRRVRTGVVSAHFFDLLGLEPLHGRGFVASDDVPGAEPVMIFSHAFWANQLGGDPGIVGSTVEMNDRVHTVVGILPPVPLFPSDNDVYMPTTSCPSRSNEEFIANRNGRMMRLFGRTRPGVTVEAASADAAAIAARLRSELPEIYTERSGYDADVVAVKDELTRDARPALLILLGTAALVLLAACANVANLSLARLVGRRRELAVRQALGAGSGRMTRQLLTESLLVALAGGALGLAFAYLGLDLLVAFAARFTPRAAEVELDATVLAFTLAVSLATGLAFGLLPVLDRRRPAAALKRSDRVRGGGGRLRSALIVAQLAVSFVLLAGAGLTVRTLVKLQQVDTGVDAQRVLAASIPLNWSKYTDQEARRDFFSRLLARTAQLPGVTSAAVASAYPMDESGPYRERLAIEGRPLPDGEMAPRIDVRAASPAYFETLGIPLVTGRLFERTDHQGSPPVVILNRTLARRYWGLEEAVGRRLKIDDEDEEWLTVVGVVDDVRQYGPASEVSEEIYVPFTQRPTGAASVLLRTTGRPRDLEASVRASVHGLDAEQAISAVTTLAEQRREHLSSPRLIATLLGLFAALALGITATGIAGVLAFSVSQRTAEIGIRMALGAARGRVVRLVLGQVLMLVAAGLGLGLVAASVLNRSLADLLFEVEPTDPFTLAMVAVVLLQVALAACLGPLAKATSVEPMTALRCD